MSHDVFISYKREDQNLASRLYQALIEEGFSVWWDTKLQTGESWGEQIQTALDNASCVIVIWTRNSAGPLGDFVRDEARSAKERGVLVPVMMEKTRIPLGFGEVQATDLIGWKGSTSNIFFQDLTGVVRAKIDGTATPSPKGPMRRMISRAGMGAGGVSVALFTLGLLSDFMSVQGFVCSANNVISDACGAVGLGGRPTGEARRAWDQVLLDLDETGECDDIRNFMQSHASSPLADTAQKKLTASRREIIHEEPEHQTQPLDIYVSRDTAPLASLEAAKSAAMQRAQEMADDSCAAYAATDSFELNDAVVEPPKNWKCTEFSTGHVCGFRGKATCDLTATKTYVEETCKGDAV